MLLAHSFWNFSHAQTSTTVLVAIHLCGLCLSTCVYVCVYTYVCWLLSACMFSVCDWAKRAHSDTHILIHTHTYYAKHPLTSQALRSAAGLQFAQSSLTAGCRRGVWWSGPGLIRLHPPSFSMCLSLTHLSPSVHPSTRLTHRLPSTNTCSHYCCLCLKYPALAGMCVSLSLPQSPPSLSWAPSTGHYLALCMCVLACLCFVSFELKCSLQFDHFIVSISMSYVCIC